jgi:hypothetical protein
MRQAIKDAFKRVAAGLFLEYAGTVGVAATFRMILIERLYEAVFFVPILFFSLGYVGIYVYRSMKDA